MLRNSILVALLAACGAFLSAGVGDAAASSGARIGVNEDATKFAKDGGASLYAQMEEIGLSQNVVSAIWTAGHDLSATDIGRISKAVAAGKAKGVKVVIAIYPASGANARALGNGGEGAFIDYVKQVVGAFHGTVKEVIVLNEPNRTIFSSPVDPTLTARVLAAAYDAIKGIDGSVDVIGLGLSPRGTGDGKSLFPVQFLVRLGAAYRALNRSAPLMDAISFHPYPFPENKAPDKTSDWPTIGMADLARLKQAIWDAFNGTGQKTVERGLPIHLDEVGYQVPTQGKPGYTGAETVKTVDEETQAAFYAKIVDQVDCDPSIASLSFFHFVDETDRRAFQSGFLDADLGARPVVASVKQALASRGCAGSAVRWSPETGVVGFDAGFAKDGRTALPNGTKVYGFAARAEEEATYKAGVFPAGTKAADAARALAVLGADVKPIATESGRIPAMLSSLAKFTLTGKNGSYVYAIKVTSTTNPNRTETAVSGKFTVGSGQGATTGGGERPQLSAGERPRIISTRGSVATRAWEVGTPLLGKPGRWTGSPRLSKVWKRCSAAGGACATIAGQTSQLYTLATADVGFTIRLEVTATNAAGSTTETSAATPAITAGAVPQLSAGSGPRVVSTESSAGVEVWTAGVGLRGKSGEWTGSPTFSYAWKRCNVTGSRCSRIAGATGRNYRPTAADVGHTLRLEVNATNAAGSTAATTSATPVITNSVAANPQLSAGEQPRIRSTRASEATRAWAVGTSLVGSSGRWTGSPRFSYAWKRCSAAGGGCVSIAGQTSIRYVLAAADVGFTIRFEVKATNDTGSTTETSAATAVITVAGR